MPFKSKAQMRAAFGGYLGPEMKSKAKSWAKETPNIAKLPMKMSRAMKMNKMDKEDIKDKKKGTYSKKEEKAEKYQSKGMRTKLNSAAEKNFFKSKSSK